MTLTIDIETRSDINLNKCGVYRYAESKNFDVLLVAVSVDGGNVHVYDIINGERLPDKIVEAMCDTKVIKYAFNVNFERVCLSEYIRKMYPELFRKAQHSDRYLSPISWRCDMIRSCYLGLPSSLEAVGGFLKLEKEKLEIGNNLKKYFCMLYANSNGMFFHTDTDDPEAWELFKEYNKRDVEAEVEIQHKLSGYMIPESIWNEFYIDQMINDRGVLIDRTFVENAVELYNEEKVRLINMLTEITGLKNPNSEKQMKKWLTGRGYPTESLDKKSVSRLLKEADTETKEVLLMYQQLSMSSLGKYKVMLKTICSDNRIRGSFRFYGASRTGRFAGRLVQLQNLPKNNLEDLEEVRELVKNHNYAEIRNRFSDVVGVLSMLIRPSFIPAEGKKYIVCDYTSVEAVVLSWLAEEEWRIDAFRRGEDIYSAAASAMFGVPVVKDGVNGHLRQKGKIAELACGYNGSVGAIKKMGGDILNLTDDELMDIVKNWRNSNPKIVHYWNTVQKTAEYVINNKTSAECGKIKLIYENGIFQIQLPSGRRLSYVGAKVEYNSEGKKVITFGAAGKSKKLSKQETYGGKIVENITQGVARDLLLHSMETLKEEYIVAHVHDELIIECDKDVSWTDICSLMIKVPKWAEDLPLRADGYECSFYMKA